MASAVELRGLAVPGRHVFLITMLGAALDFLVFRRGSESQLCLLVAEAASVSSYFQHLVFHSIFCSYSSSRHFLSRSLPGFGSSIPS